MNRCRAWWLASRGVVATRRLVSSQPAVFAGAPLHLRCAAPSPASSLLVHTRRSLCSGTPLFGGFAAGGVPPPPAALRGFAAEAMKVYKPTSPGQRGRVTTSRVDLWKGRPVKALTVGLRKSGGRNNAGRVTSRHRGGGAKRLYRVVDFARAPSTTRGLVTRLEYDPNRSARIALVNYAAAAVGDAPASPPRLSYILAPEGVKPGDSVASGPDAGIFPGNALALNDMPAGTTIHNIEMRPGGGGKLVRAAGTSAVLVKKGTDGYATVRLASGETRLLRGECVATVGVVGNKEHHNRKLGKAGASRHLGRRPHVRGVAMNPVDHPHGGGEGKTSGGRPSVTPWGFPTKGYRTRKNKRTDALIVERRYGRGG